MHFEDYQVKQIWSLVHYREEDENEKGVSFRTLAFDDIAMAILADRHLPRHYEIDSSVLQYWLSSKTFRIRTYNATIQ